MGIGLFQRIRKLRLPKRRKAQTQTPILTWEEIQEDDRAAFVEQVVKEAEEDIRESEQSFRSLN